MIVHLPPPGSYVRNGPAKHFKNKGIIRIHIDSLCFKESSSVASKAIKSKNHPFRFAINRNRTRIDVVKEFLSYFASKKMEYCN